MSKNILIGGDFNCHHELWGSNKINIHGTECAEMFLSQGFICANNGSATRRDNTIQTNPSAIDLTWTSPNLSNMLQSWRTDPHNPFQSDHHPIYFKSNCSTSIQQPHRYTWKIPDLEKAEKFQEFELRVTQQLSHWLNMYDQENLENYNINTMCQDWNICVRTAALQSFGTKQSRLDATPWWNDELLSLARGARKARKKWQKHRTEEHRRIFYDKRYKFRATKSNNG